MLLVLLIVLFVNAEVHLTLEGADIQGVPHTFFFLTPYQFTADVYKRQEPARFHMDSCSGAACPSGLLWSVCVRLEEPELEAVLWSEPACFPAW